MRGFISRLTQSDNLSRWFASLLVIVRSWKLGLLLALGAILVVGLRFDTEDFKALASVSPVLILASGFLFAIGSLALALAPAASGSFDGRAFGSGMAAQLLKYVPGSIWQGQRLLATGGGAALGKFAVVVVFAAGLALLASGHLWTAILGLVVAAVGWWIGKSRWGIEYGTRAMWISVVVVLSIGASGGVLGAGMGLDFFSSARDMVGAWGLGVVAVPVPAGLGIRELYLDLSGSSGVGLEFGVAHRLISLGADIIVGVVGMWLGSPKRKSQPAR